MWKAKQYKDAVFYLEACEAGSMFNTFPKDQKFYALTAANPSESSWGNYCPPDDSIKGTHIGSCLGDLFSNVWMEDTDASDTSRETLTQQFKKVQQLTTKSHVMQYGDLSFQDMTVSTFIGNQKKMQSRKSEVQGSTVDSRDVKLMYLVNRHSRLMTMESQNELNEEIQSRRMYDDLFTEVKTFVGNSSMATNTDFSCYQDMIESLEASCGRTSDYGLKYFRHLYDICACESCSQKDVKLLFAKKCINSFKSVASA